MSEEVKPKNPMFGVREKVAADLKAKATDDTDDIHSEKTQVLDGQNDELRIMRLQERIGSLEDELSTTKAQLQESQGERGYLAERVEQAQKMFEEELEPQLEAARGLVEGLQGDVDRLKGGYADFIMDTVQAADEQSLAEQVRPYLFDEKDDLRDYDLVDFDGLAERIGAHINNLKVSLAHARDQTREAQGQLAQVKANVPKMVMGVDAVARYQALKPIADALGFELRDPETDEETAKEYDVYAGKLSQGLAGTLGEVLEKAQAHDGLQDEKARLEALAQGRQERIDALSDELRKLGETLESTKEQYSGKVGTLERAVEKVKERAKELLEMEQEARGKEVSRLRSMLASQEEPPVYEPDALLDTDDVAIVQDTKAKELLDKATAQMPKYEGIKGLGARVKENFTNLDYGRVELGWLERAKALVAQPNPEAYQRAALGRAKKVGDDARIPALELARELNYQGKHREALAALSEVKPGTDPVYNAQLNEARGEAHFGRGNLEIAERRYADSLRWMPPQEADDRREEIRGALANLNEGRLSEAHAEILMDLAGKVKAESQTIDLYRNASKLTARADPHVALAGIYERKGNTFQAVREYRQACRRSLDGERGLHMIGLSEQYLNGGNKALARTYAFRARKLLREAGELSDGLSEKLAELLDASKPFRTSLATLG